MNYQPLFFQARRYNIATEVFDGPLDLLLQLIEKTELDITMIALAQITDQFLSYLSKIEEYYPAEISAFLVIAARLIQIKSEALLPKPSYQTNFDDEEDAGELLIQQLLAYKQFRTIANKFAERENHRLTTYLRVAPIHSSTTGVVLNGYDLEQMASIFIQMINKGNDKKAPLQTIVSIPKITIREKINYIQSLLRKYQQINFFRLIIDFTSRIEIVVTFLAMLELIKRDFLIVNQSSLFGDIFIQRGGKWEYHMDVECEFGE